MKKAILSLSVALMSLGTFAQNECKCTDNTYEIVGEETFSECGMKYYAGLKENTVYFTQIQYAGDKVQQIYISSMGVDDISLDMNNMFSSRSKTVDETGYTELTLGGSNKDTRYVAKYQWDKCYLNMSSMSYSEQARNTIIGRFADKGKIVKLTDEIKALKEN